MANAQLWKSFRSDCIEAMERFNANEIGWPELEDYLRKYDEIEIDDEMVQFIWNTISEIDGSHRHYLETLDLLKSGVSEAELTEYMNRPSPPLLPAWLRQLFGAD